MPQDITQQLTQVLRATFHFQEFRPGQLAALTAVMTHGRLVCIQPTGHGKSLLYQLPSMLLQGITLVISPLLALMRDQQQQLKNRFDIAAASINTDQTQPENDAARRAVLAGQVRILFMAPEQLDDLERFEFLLRLPVRLLVVDEAHCISTWGHDFRPSYRQIIKLAHALMQKNPEIKLLALTATANSKTESDIKQQLTVDDKEIVIHRESMDRPNIRLAVIPITGMAAKLTVLANLLTTLHGTGLIYCATRENTEVVAEYLSGRGVHTVAYHAGIDTDKKRVIQQDFIQDKYTVISATNALGMGIDKSNLRFVIHFDFPGSITAYYQEVGRVGRDGLPADGILLYDPVDSKIQKYFIESAQPSAMDFKNVLDVIASSAEMLNLTAIKRLSGLHPTKLTVMIAECVEQGFLLKVSRNRLQVYQRTNKKGVPDLNRYLTQFELRMSELQSIQRYAEQTQKCLMVILRKLLGDQVAESCGQCSVCADLSFENLQNNDLAVTVASWLNRRTVPIVLSQKIKNTTPGLAVLDGKWRSKEFVSFMQHRATSQHAQLGLSDDLLQLIKTCLHELAEHHQLECIVALPSRTWAARDMLIRLFANYLKIPVMLDLLYWSEDPAARQGELLNNDQRQHNVHMRMRAKTDKMLPQGAILLFDDYIGSGATLNEASKALRERDIPNKIVPFTIAAVKWRLGKRGMI